MSSEQKPGQSPARRRMAGYTPPAAQSAAPATEHEAPAPAVAEPEATAPETQVPELPTAAQTPTPAGQVEPASAAAAHQPEETPEPAATEASARKRRMGSAPAPAAAAAPTAPAAPAGQDASPAGQDAATAQPAAGEPTAYPAAANAPTASAAGAPKRRMGGAPAAQASTPPAPASDTPASEIGDAAASKKRMGGAPTSAKTRMGAAPATGSAASTAAASSSTAPASTGSATPAPAASTTAPSASTTASTSGTAATTTSANRPPSGTAGTPGPAGAATPPKPERPWVKPALIIGGLVVVAVAVVLGARWLRTLEGVQEFIATYDGHSTQLEAAPEGMPWWMGWQHFFNMFLIVLIIRTGLQVRNERKPPGYWTAKKGSFFSPKGNTPKKVSLTQWLHQSLDVLWVLNGLIFIILLFATGHWMRIVPTDWDVFPNMLSGAIQYASLDWPTENGWVNYNALQTVAYGFTVFIAAPLAILSGIRFSTWWPDNAEKLNKIYPVEWARATHFPVMIYFVAFTIVHVFLVFFTGALRNLNHMYTSRDVVDWWGLVIFLVSLVVTAAAWFLSKPLFTTPIAAQMGKISK
ncbi:cytochrome b/b6 domain-containing protein [Citricoccus sp. NPDC079358]|uniref:cytochrome b/b6 domain-containing protein n=1 Tax=Citricoccus sp. NPDC079358 TaxID=3154653 RepID=UPI00344C34BC